MIIRQTNNKYSKRSLDNLYTCDYKLREVFFEVIKWTDCSIICGYRDEKAQNEYYAKGATMLKYPKSYHNLQPSIAVDVIPYPVVWTDLNSFIELSNIVKIVASSKGIDIRWGGDWEFFKDMPHYQLQV